MVKHLHFKLTNNLNNGRGCPVHCSFAEETFGRDVQSITDKDLVAHTVWEGLTYMCPICKVPSIMANEYMGTVCSCCGRKVLIQSAEFNRFITAKQTSKQGR